MIETARLRLIRWEEAHFQAIFENNLIKLGELLDVQTPEAWTTFDDMADAVPFFTTLIKKMATIGAAFLQFTKPISDFWALVDIKVDQTRKLLLKLVYEIEASYRNQGLASEAAQGLIDFAFNMLKFRKLRHIRWQTRTPQYRSWKN